MKLLLQSLIGLGLLWAVLSPSQQVFAQNTLSGIIQDEFGSPVLGVNVRVDGSNLGTVSTAQGTYTLKLGNRFPVLVEYSAIGFKSKKILVRGAGEINLVLEDQVATLSEIVVTALRSPSDLEGEPRAMEVINANTLERSDYREVSDVLKRETALSLVQFPGLLSGIGIRGFQPNISGINPRTLLLVNGRPAGATNLATLSVQSLERVEILKGPASALYGSQAMGGVINFITRSSQGDIQGSVWGEFGSFNRTEFGLSTGGSLSQKLDFDIDLHSFNRPRDFEIGRGNVFRRILENGKATQHFFDGSQAQVDDTQGDGQRRPSTQQTFYDGRIRLGYNFAPGWRLQAQQEFWRAPKVETPGDIAFGDAQASEKESERYTSEFTLSKKFDKSTLSLTGSLSQESTDFISTRDFSGVPIDPFVSFTDKSSFWSVQGRYVLPLGAHGLIMGLDHNHSKSETNSFNSDGTSNPRFNPDFSIKSTGIYVQGRFVFLQERLILSPGLRQDFNQFRVFPTETFVGFSIGTQEGGRENSSFFSPSLAAQYNILPTFNIHGSLGRAFVTPNGSQIAGTAESGTGTGQVSVFQGNPELDNESSLGWDLGLEYDNYTSGFRIDFTYFRTKVQDRIIQVTENPENQTTPAGDLIASITTFENSNESEMRGFEMEVSYDLGALSNYRYSLRFFTQATRNLRAKDIIKTEGFDDVEIQIRNVPDLAVNYGISYNNQKNIQLDLTGRFVGERWDLDFTNPNFPEILYPGFMTMDFAAHYTFLQQHRFSLFINNLSDENYYEKRGFNMPGRNYSIRYRWQF